MSREKISFRLDGEVQIPQLPNFLIVKVGQQEHSVPIKAFDARTLTDIAKRWRDALLAKAAKDQGAA